MSNKDCGDTDKSDDKKKIEDEEREKMLNTENEASTGVVTGGGGGAVVIKPSSLEIEDGREVKPKKIPIGGIKMPGFFTRSRSKEKCKEDDEEDGEQNQSGNQQNEKIEYNNEENKGTLRKGIKLPIVFNKKSKTDVNDEENEKITAESAANRKKLIDSIKQPLVSAFGKFRRPPETESGNLAVSATQAGLASAETLGDFDKTDDGMESIKLDGDKNDDIEKQELTEKEGWFETALRHRISIGGVLIFIIIVIIILLVTLIGKKHVPVSPPIEQGKYVTAVTSCGKVQGILEDGAFAFRGIPYAVPPIDERRWLKAGALNDLKYCWDDVLIAHNATPACAQIHSNGSTSGVESCLTLDVVTPYVRYENPIPVIVLIGTESFIGGSPSKMRPSASYARSRDVIFVRPNFRLGVLGFLAAAPLSQATYPHTSGNYGLSDIILALQWVQLNIEHFGGDKNSVTLLGHRTGATLVTALATSRKCKGLFSKVWATSGSAKFPGKQLSDSERENKEFLDILQCKNNDVKCLREKNVAELLDNVPDTWRHVQPDVPQEDERPNERHEWLVLDGDILQKHPVDSWRDDKPKVQIMIGTTAHVSASQKLFLKHTEWTPELVKEHIQSSFFGKQNLTDEIFKRYNQTYRDLVQLISDVRTVCPLLAFSSQLENATFYVATITRGDNLLADVDSDIDAILGRYEAKTPERRRYVSAMQQLFYHFVWHGTIAPTIQNSYNKVLIVDQDILPNPEYPNCDFWINKNIVPLYASID
ncbi:neurotactin [Chrysoperla carnea]|uniref:neurotactin n=1 Tax=Chrysoperla carnea TaxID=189513 RepID=UPI001D082F4B|nr:neurotactin [Chrysoperla carnea]